MFVGDETPEEVGIYHDDQISVGPLRITPDRGKSIAVANVAGAWVNEAGGNQGPGIAIAVVGALVGGACLLSGPEELRIVAGLFLVGCAFVGIAVATYGQKRYRVEVQLVGGKTRRVLETRDDAQAEAAVRAINRVARRAR